LPERGGVIDALGCPPRSRVAALACFAWRT